MKASNPFNIVLLGVLCDWIEALCSVAFSGKSLESSSL